LAERFDWARNDVCLDNIRTNEYFCSYYHTTVAASPTLSPATGIDNYKDGKLEDIVFQNYGWQINSANESLCLGTSTHSINPYGDCAAD
ncbi:hypothetical protein HK098_006144, partial [Nowakowskiella sp. JEL0407]